VKILNLVFHPDLTTSRVNRAWKRILEESGKIDSSVDMYRRYPDFAVDVEQGQASLLEHDRIIFQFPMYWYSMTPLLKRKHWVGPRQLTDGYCFLYVDRALPLANSSFQAVFLWVFVLHLRRLRFS
jgi:putative NADPH-quinone reductase